MGWMARLHEQWGRDRDCDTGCVWVWVGFGSRVFEAHNEFTWILTRTHVKAPRSRRLLGVSPFPFSVCFNRLIINKN